MRSRWLSLFAVFSLGGSLLFAQTPRLRTRPDGPPPLPFPAPFASRGQMLGSQQWKRVAQDTPDPNQQTVMLPLSAGITVISIPLRTQSQLLSDLLPNLPSGSRVWTWDAEQQQFVEGFDQQLPEGQGAVLYLPSPTVVSITGDPELSDRFPVDLQHGWNLVGVPYSVPLLRSSQTVYSAGMSAGFNDAVNNGDLGPDVFSLDSRGQQAVGENDLFHPMDAYWVYSNDAELLELQPLRLGIAVPPWVLEKIGGTLIQFGGSYLLSYLKPDPNQAVLDQLATVSAQIQNVQDTQSFMVGRLSDLENKMDLNAEATQQLIGEQPIEAVRTNLKVDYDGTKPYESFMWFQNAVIKANQNPPDKSDLNLINDQVKVDFDRKVIGETGPVDYQKQFQAIYNAINPIRQRGVLDNYAKQIVLGRNQLTLEQRYMAMEQYFDTLLGYQAKCMILVTNAYNDLAQNPKAPRPYPAAYAEQWRTGTYVPAIKDEVNRFRTAVETILVGSLTIRSQGSDPAVSVPPEVQDVIMSRTDFLAMKLLQEAPGLRLRVLVAPDMNPSNTYQVVSRAYNYGVALPSTDSGLWTRVAGVTPYDSWQIDPPTSMPKFFVQKDWLMWKPAAFPGGTSYPCSRYQPCRFFIYDAWKLTDQTPAAYKDLNVRFVDDNGQPAQSGTSFGSLVLVLRATANTMLTVKSGQTSGVCSNRNVFIVNDSANEFVIKDCRGAMTINGQVPFLFGGGTPSLGDWEMNMDYQQAGNLLKWYGIIRLTDGNSILSDINTTFKPSGSYSRETKNIQWLTGRTYSFQMYLYHEEQPWICSGYPQRCPTPAYSSVLRKALIMRFK